MSVERPRLSRILSLVGAGIVLATFVVKDIMSERLRDLNASLSGAEAFYLTQTSSQFIEDDLVYLKQEIDQTFVAASQKGELSTIDRETTVSIRAEASKGHLATVMEYVQNLARLDARLPGEQSNASEIKKLLTECEKSMAAIESLQESSPSLFAAINTDPQDPTALRRLAEYVKRTSTIQPTADSIMKSAKAVTETVLSDLKANEKRSTRDYSMATMVSYVLFVLGWATSLLGQLLPSDTRSSDSEDVILRESRAPLTT